MQFFLYEIVARIVAAYLCVDCWRKIRAALVTRKIAIINADPLDWFSYSPADRDTAPFTYWITIGLQAMYFVSCLVVTILGWWHP